MYEIDPDRTDLAEEFRSDPFAQHSPELQLLLNRMRKGSARGRLALVVTGPNEYTLAELSGIRGVPPTVLHEHRFADPAAAEWAAFKLRWERLTGRSLELGQRTIGDA